MIFRQSTKKFVVVFIAVIMVNGFGQSKITFDVDGANTVIANEIFGLLMERLGRQWTNNGIFVGTGSSIKNTNGMRNDVIDAFKECGVGAVQWPGGCAANGYNWSSNKTPSNDVGVDRFIEFCKLTGAEAMISGKPTGNDAASNLAFAKYIIETLEYPLKWFKIGNEIWGGCGSGQNFTNGYSSGFNANVEKLNTLKSSANGKNLQYIAAAGATEGNYSWISGHYNAMGNTMNAIEFHDYIYRRTINCANPSTADYWQIMSDVFSGDFHGHLFNNIIPGMNAADPQKKVKICFDEWGDWLTADNWMQTVTVMDAISAGGHLNQFIQNADRVGAACLAQGVNVIHSIININTSGVMVKTPAFYVFKMYKPHHTNNAKYLPITSSSYEKANGNVPAVSSAASVDDSGIVNVSFTNCDISATRKVTVTLTTNKEYGIKSGEVITGPAINTTNPFGGAEQVNIQTLEASNVSISGNVLSVTLPSKSVVMVRLSSIPDAVQSVQKSRSGAGEIAINAGLRGGIQVTSSVVHATPVTISFFSINGRTLKGRSSGVLEAGANRTQVFGNDVIGRGVYLVKVTGANVNVTKKVAVAK
jgi:alpha-N-arabinofuranosidase